MTRRPPDAYDQTVDSTKTSYRLIREAYRLLNRKKFPEAQLVLENVLTSGVGDIYVLLLLSVVYLYTDQFGRLARFLVKMRELDPAFMPMVQMEAFLKLKSAGNAEEALRLYVELSAKYPADPHIRRGRGLLSQADDFTAFQKNARLRDFVDVPPPPGRLKKARRGVYTGTLGPRGIRIHGGGGVVRRATAIRIVIAVSLAGLAGAGIWALARYGIPPLLERLRGPGNDRDAIDMVNVSGTEFDLVKSIRKETVPVYYRSARDMTADFDRSRTLIKNRRYNEALLILNGLHHSNVNFVVKEKAEFLIKFVVNQEERDFEEIPCRKVCETRYRYRGFAVRWKGSVESLREKDRSTVISLTAEAPGGNAPCRADIYSSRPVQKLEKGSRIVVEGVIIDFPGKDRRPYLESRGIRMLR